MQQKNDPTFLDVGNGVKVLQDKNRFSFIPDPGNTKEVETAVKGILYILAHIGIMQVGHSQQKQLTTQSVGQSADFPIQWPAWRYGPDGQSEIFESEDQVPDGWVEHPGLLLGVDPINLQPLSTAEAGTGDVKDAFDGVSDAEIEKHLKAAKISYEKGWPRDKLISLLKAASA